MELWPAQPRDDVLECCVRRIPPSSWGTAAPLVSCLRTASDGLKHPYFEAIVVSRLLWCNRVGCLSACGERLRTCPCHRLCSLCLFCCAHSVVFCRGSWHAGAMMVITLMGNKEFLISPPVRPCCAVVAPAALEGGADSDRPGPGDLGSLVSEEAHGRAGHRRRRREELTPITCWSLLHFATGASHFWSTPLRESISLQRINITWRDISRCFVSCLDTFSAAQVLRSTC